MITDIILVTANVLGFYQSISHTVSLRALKESLYKGYEKKIPTEEILKMAEFVLKNNYLEFGIKTKQ